MSKEVIGFRRYDFEDKEGNAVKGYNIYLKWLDKTTQGVACEAISLTDRKLEGYSPKLGDRLRVGYNAYKKAEFVVLSAAEPC